jgi:hypothetical protein
VSTANDRDGGIERQLGTALRRRMEPAPVACPDAELIAGYVERTLSGEERGLLEGHLVRCARCQEVLSLVLRSDMADEAERREVAHRWWSFGALHRRARWLVPASAAAIVVAVALAGYWPRDAQRDPASVTADRMLEHQERAAAPSAEGTGASPGGIAGPVATPPAGTGPAGRSPAALADRSEAQEPGPTPPASSAPRMAAAPDVAPVPDRAAEHGDIPRDTPRARRDAVAELADEKGREQDPGAPRAMAAREAAAAGPSPSAVAASPGGDVLLRVGPAGAIARSPDAGRTWVAQASGVTADLLAASCATTEVCWAVGRGGTVLLTVDGSTWTRAAFPGDTDLTAVRAADARTAAVEGADARYETRDGGRTWQRTR